MANEEALRAGDAAAGEGEGEFSRRERKNNREKQRRSEVNTMFDMLNRSLGLNPAVRLDKISLLSTAIDTIDALRAQVDAVHAAGLLLPSTGRTDG